MIKKIFILTSICIFAFLVGCGKKTEPLDIPSYDTITSIEITTIDGTKVDIVNANEIEAIVSALGAAETTQLQSVNDQPTNIEVYGSLSINSDDRSTVVYYYEKDGEYYAEQPYMGIYKLNGNLEDLME